MMQLTDLVLVLVMCGIIVIYVYSEPATNTEVVIKTSSIDGRKYVVLKLPDAQQAADFIADINVDLVELVHHLVSKYPDNEDVVRLYDNFDPDRVSEGSIESGYTSYSVNKGEKIILCIRQSDGSFVEKNILLYVAIHELAHIMTSEVGHTPLFWSNFKFILSEAIEIAIYRKVDFDDRPEDYCGIKISSSVV